MPARDWVLVLNCGSSSIKAALLDSRGLGPEARATGLGSPEARLHSSFAKESYPLAEGERIEATIDRVLELLCTQPEAEALVAVGHRVVHGGRRFSTPTTLSASVVEELEALEPLAPLHLPANLAGIRRTLARFPKLPQVAVFDTAFHRTLPRRARHYALPHTRAEAAGVERYGFHGTSHDYVSGLAADFLGEPRARLRIVSCHLGNGASVCAVERGRSVETSMGMTPAEGLVMGTRAGDIDAGALLALARSEGLDLEGLDHLINRESGLAGVSGRGADMRAIEAGASEGDERSRLALQVFCHRLKKYIGAYAAIMGGVDAIVFTAGIGENSATVRARACRELAFLGARLDEDANRSARPSPEAPVVEISEAGARCRLLVVRTDEQAAIALATRARAERPENFDGELPPIPISVSARHVHLTREALEVLFGEGHELRVRNELSQPGQFAAEECVEVVGPKRSISGVRVLGPLRSKIQVEISRTDEFHLGLDAPVRASGKVTGSAACTLVGPAGRLTIPEGVICAWRHIHMRPEDAQRYGVAHGESVEVEVDSEGRDLVFGDVLVRVSPKYALEMHIDTDEANAAELPRESSGMLVRTGGHARLRRRES